MSTLEAINLGLGAIGTLAAVTGFGIWLKGKRAPKASDYTDARKKHDR